MAHTTQCFIAETAKIEFLSKKRISERRPDPFIWTNGIDLFKNN